MRALRRERCAPSSIGAEAWSSATRTSPSATSGGTSRGFVWTVANTLTIVFIAEGIEATGGQLDVERRR